MKRLLTLLVVLGIAGSPALAISFYETNDVPTDLAGVTYLPWDVLRNDSGMYSFITSLPMNTQVDSLHAMCSGDWLVSVETPTELPPAGGAYFDPRDVVQWDGGAVYSLFFDGGAIGIPAGSNVDAAFLRGGDNSPLILSFDVPTDLTAMGGGIYDPADLVEFQHAMPGPAGWALVGLFFDASAPATPVPQSDNVTGADVRGLDTVMTFDVPTTLGLPTYLPGTMVSWTGLSFANYYTYAAWPASSRHDSFAFLADPGTVPPTITMGKSTLVIGDVHVNHLPSTSAGVDDYALYEGTLLSWYSHSPKTCNYISGTDFTPQAADSYYLVVPINANDEGSYGTNSSGTERPQGTGACRPTQALACP